MKQNLIILLVSILLLISYVEGISDYFYNDASCTTLMPSSFQYRDGYSQQLRNIVNPDVGQDVGSCMNVNAGSTLSQLLKSCNTSYSVYQDFTVSNCNNAFFRREVVQENPNCVFFNLD